MDRRVPKDMDLDMEFLGMDAEDIYADNMDNHTNRKTLKPHYSCTCY